MGCTLLPPVYGLIATGISQSALPFFVLILNGLLAITVTKKAIYAKKAGRF